MTSLSKILKCIVEPWSAALLQSPLAELTRSGALPPHALAAYLESLRYLFESSERHLELAIARSEQLGDAALVQYFQRKTREEVGHDRWASDDLAQLPAAAKRRLEPAHNITRLVALQRELIEQHPVCFVAYILWTEYFSVLVGDSWLDALERSGYPRAQISAIAKHIEADREHSAAVLAEIDVLWQGQPELATVVAGIEHAIRLFEAFCEEICVVAARAA